MNTSNTPIENLQNVNVFALQHYGAAGSCTAYSYQDVVESLKDDTFDDVGAGNCKICIHRLDFSRWTSLDMADMYWIRLFPVYWSRKEYFRECCARRVSLVIFERRALVFISTCALIFLEASTARLSTKLLTRHWLIMAEERTTRLVEQYSYSRINNSFQKSGSRWDSMLLIFSGYQGDLTQRLSRSLACSGLT